MKKLLIICLCIFMIGVQLPAPVYALDAESSDLIDELNQRYDELEEKQQAIQNEINQAKTEKDKMLAEKEQIDNQISTTRNQISILNQKIALMEESLSEKELEAERKTEEIEVSLELFKDRMYAMYVTPQNSTLSLLLGSHDFVSFLTSMEYATRIAERDNELLDDMREELEVLLETQREIEANKEAIEVDKSAVADKEIELDAQLTQVENDIQDVSLLESQYLANKASLQAEMDDIDDEIQEIYRAAQDSGALADTYIGGGMAWPVPGHTYISSNYGWRFSGTNFHTGFDIAGTGSDGLGIYGKPIVAANDGTVIFTQTSYIYGVGYGIYLMIDHGGGISTLYGHTSKLAVTLGQTVSKGQTIAYVGSTGWSTGPHLHFEVRKDGSYVYPWDYISVP